MAEYAFNPALGSALLLKIVSPRGKAFSVKAAATHDHGMPLGDAAGAHLVDAAFLARLPDGRRLRESISACDREVGGVSCGAEFSVVGKLTQELHVCIKVVPKDVHCTDAERYPVSYTHLTLPTICSV